MLDLFLESSSAFEKATILVPSLDYVNYFGFSRNSKVVWKILDFNVTIPVLLAHRVNKWIRSSDLVLFEGHLTGLQNMLGSLDAGNLKKKPIVALLHGSVRLRRLKALKSITWTRIHHRLVGGATDGVFWLGFNQPLRSDLSSPPGYCPLVMSDLLEYAPKDVHVTSVDTPLKSVSSTRSEITLPHMTLENVSYSFGLFPFKTIDGKVDHRIITSSPFSRTGWALRRITTVELTRFLDVPVAIEKRLATSGLTVLPRTHPIRTSFPSKVLSHSLWTTGFLSIHGRGVDVFQPKFSRDQITGNIVSQDRFGAQGEKIDEKAAKMDDASVPVNLWNNRLISTYPGTLLTTKVTRQKLEWSLNILRKYLIGAWSKRVYKSLLKYLELTWPTELSLLTCGFGKKIDVNHPFWKDLDAGLDCLMYASKTTWWEWPGGSRLFFWRWTPEFKLFARDGIPVCWLPGKQPTSRKPQPPVLDTNVRKRMTTKLAKVRNRGYVAPGFVKSLIRFFAVPKGMDDIRMVYDGTASHFNDAVWVPTFGLPTIATLLRGTGPNTWMVDLDIGDMFLNFMLDEEARELVGVDITHFFRDEMTEDQIAKWERWLRCAMGLKVSPNHAIRAVLFAEEFMKGNPKNPKNPFAYQLVVLNLPGSDIYDPTKPWFFILDFDGKLATILVIYVDDERIHASTEEKAWAASHQVATREAYLGIQDAARKRRPPSQNAGAWAGSMVRTNNLEVGILISQERWEKTRSIIRKWSDKMRKNPDQELNTTDLLSDRGFLIYVTRTYDCMVPFLKGLHLTIDSWRSGRDGEGWKVATAYVQRISRTDDSARDVPVDDKYPGTVKAVPRLKNDLRALELMTEDLTAPVVVVRSKRILLVRYGFGDASGGGFGSSLTSRIGIKVQIGTWNEQGSNKSSNFRELGNFVLRLEKEAALGELEGSEIFLFTDNSTAESAFHNGTSSSKTLFELVIRIRKLQLVQSVKIHLIHVAGTRMIDQGTDGISRGNLLEGVMAGKDMLSFVPINQSAIERSNGLLTWLRDWTNCNSLSPLTPEDWLWKGHGLGEKTWTNIDGMKFPVSSDKDTFLWTPPPAIADVALELLRTSIHRRPQFYHLFICPKLMTYRWRKNLLKTCDFSFYLDAKNPEIWGKEMHESLLIAVYLPLLPCHPWTYRRSKSVLELERLLRRVPASQARAQGSILRKFFVFTRYLPRLQDGVVRELLSKGRIG